MATLIPRSGRKANGGIQRVQDVIPLGRATDLTSLWHCFSVYLLSVDFCAKPYWSKSLRSHRETWSLSHSFSRGLNSRQCRRPNFGEDWSWLEPCSVYLHSPRWTDSRVATHWPRSPSADSFSMNPLNTGTLAQTLFRTCFVCPPVCLSIHPAAAVALCIHLSIYLSVKVDRYSWHHSWKFTYDSLAPRDRYVCYHGDGSRWKGFIWVLQK